MQMPADVKQYNRELIAEFRAAGRQLPGRSILLLTTTGRCSGKEHTTPMLGVPDGDRWLVVASDAGAADDPDWYRNLLADPQVTVEVAGGEFAGTATPLPEAERSVAFAHLIETYPFFKDHQEKVNRTIPVVALQRS